jgi:tRNA dimethylallyltransferase
MVVSKIKTCSAPLIVIVGPTASGKTGLAVRLAQKYDGAIICADSRTVYKGMDIGAAKPTMAERGGVPHYMIDVVEPNKKFTLYDFQHLTRKFIKEIRAKGQIPFLVGGSGLYIDSILFDYELGDAPNVKSREKLEKMNTADLLSLLRKQHVEIPSNFHNKRHLIHAIEQNGVNRARRDKIIDNAYVVGISTEKDVLEQRIRERAKQMLHNGFIDEVRQLVIKYNDQEPFRRNSYGEVRKYLRGEILTKNELLERMVIVDRQLVKKQLTWFRRNPEINWLPLGEAEIFLGDKLKQNKIYLTEHIFTKL